MLKSQNENRLYQNEIFKCHKAGLPVVCIGIKMRIA